jgi:hypothetical protein
MELELREELSLLSRNVEEMICFVQRAADAGIWTPQEGTRHTTRLEFLHANLTADFRELLVLRETCQWVAAQHAKRTATHKEITFVAVATIQTQSLQRLYALSGE